jgi:hypothetical protein
MHDSSGPEITRPVDPVGRELPRLIWKPFSGLAEEGDFSVSGLLNLSDGLLGKDYIFISFSIGTHPELGGDAAGYWRCRGAPKRPAWRIAIRYADLEQLTSPEITAKKWTELTMEPQLLTSFELTEVSRISSGALLKMEC